MPAHLDAGKDKSSMKRKRNEGGETLKIEDKISDNYRRKKLQCEIIE